MYQLYYNQGSGSMVIEAALAMAGQGYQLESVPDRAAMLSGAVAKLNPAVKIPVLVLPDGHAVSESMAILLVLDERHPEAGLLPPTGSKDRAIALQWLSFLASSIYPAALRFFYADRYTTQHEEAALDALRASASASQDHDFSLFAAALKGPCLFGDTASIVDVYAAMLADWHAPAMQLAPYQALKAAILAHPAIRKAWINHAYAL
jgi:glutathione S-transferase